MIVRRPPDWIAAIRRFAVCLVLVLGVTMIAFSSSAVAKPPKVPPKQAVAVGVGGAAATVDPLASQAAIRVLDQGGNAVDAAVAAAAVLGATEPYTCGIGGGGFMVIYLAADERIVTLDARETAPQAFRADSFIDPATGQPIPFDERVTSGLGVGVPGTLLSWDVAQRRFGTMNLARVLAPAIAIAARGFTVDQVHHNQTLENRDRFRDFPASRELFSPRAATRRRSARPSAIPTWPTPTVSSPTRASMRSTAGRSGRLSSIRCSTRWLLPIRRGTSGRGS